MKKLLHNLPFYSWIAANVAAISLCILMVLHVFSVYKEYGNSAIIDGKKIEVNLKTSKITSKESIEKEQKAAITATKSTKSPIETRHYITSDETSKLSIIITGLGLDKSITDEVINLPSFVTLSFSTYAPNIGNFAEVAKRSGHEILLDIPMQTKNYPMDDSGQKSLLTHSGKTKNLFRLKTILASTQGEIGVFGGVDEKFTFSLVSVLPIIDELRKQNLFFIYNEKPSNDFLREEARAIGLSTIAGYIVIDSVLSEEAIDKKLEEIRKSVVEENKSVVAVGNSYPLTIKRIDRWLKTQKKEDIKFAPVSYLVEKN